MLLITVRSDIQNFESPEISIPKPMTQCRTHVYWNTWNINRTQRAFIKNSMRQQKTTLHVRIKSWLHKLSSSAVATKENLCPPLLFCIDPHDTNKSITESFFKNNQNNVLHWFHQSPHLNPIQMLWRGLKQGSYLLLIMPAFNYLYTYPRWLPCANPSN